MTCAAIFRRHSVETKAFWVRKRLWDENDLQSWGQNARGLPPKLPTQKSSWQYHWATEAVFAVRMNARKRWYHISVTFTIISGQKNTFPGSMLKFRVNQTRVPARREGLRVSWEERINYIDTIYSADTYKLTARLKSIGKMLLWPSLYTFH